ncbi:MAG: FliH/SctL family protein [Syntrophorhabdaceae bacterium]
MKTGNMETFIFYDLGEEMPEEKDTGFIRLFDEAEAVLQTEEAIAASSQPKINVEEEARRIFEEAYAQGEKAGHEMGMKRAQPLVKRLGTFLAELSVFKEELVKRAETLSTELALAFSEAIILRECREHRDAVLRMVRKALSLCEEQSGTTIRLRREDAAHISGEELSHFKIIRDDTLHEPGFIIETNFGDIDGRISVQIEELKKEFLNGTID